MDKDTILKLQPNDSTEIVEITLRAAEKSELVKDLLNDFGKDDNIVIQEASHNALVRIVEYLNHYVDSEPMKIQAPIPDDKELKDVTDHWDIEFLDKMEINDKYDVVSGAEFMRIEPLHKLISANFACIIRTLDTPGIMKYFNIEEDMTQEEMEQMEKEDEEQLMKELQDEEIRIKILWDEEIRKQEEAK